ncbi:MAG: hypothetical protein U0354_01865 [Candidatus Sericytochromatia bacterium]
MKILINLNKNFIDSINSSVIKLLIKQLSFFLLFIGLTITQANAQENSLGKCWNKQVKETVNNYLNIYFDENLNQLEHNFKPWAQTNYLIKGKAWINYDNFIKEDKLPFNGKDYFSKTVFNKSELLLINYGEDSLSKITKEAFLEQTFKNSRYSPINIINYFFYNKIKISSKSNKEFDIYESKINNTIVSLYISKKDNLLIKVNLLDNDDLYGDVLTSFNYSKFSKLNNLYFPRKISIEKINRKLKDSIDISNALLTKKIPEILTKPSDYTFVKEVPSKPEISFKKYNESIYFIELKHTDDRVMVVEFENFVLVAEAPINSENGELIISEIKKNIKNKPIKYFVFGHHHPHYLGGIRAFIHEGANIISLDMNKDYINYIANAKHSIKPDNLEKEYKKVQFKDLKDSLLIEDNKTKLQIFFIGEKSQHTNDYLIYFFPNEKILFEDDLLQYNGHK